MNKLDILNTILLFFAISFNAYSDTLFGKVITSITAVLNAFVLGMEYKEYIDRKQEEEE